MLLFVDVDQHVAVHGGGQPAALDLARLVDAVAVGDDGGEGDGAQVRQRVERAGVDARSERVVHDERVNLSQLRLVAQLRTKPREGERVVYRAGLGAHVFVDLPEARDQRVAQ